MLFRVTYIAHQHFSTGDFQLYISMSIFNLMIKRKVIYSSNHQHHTQKPTAHSLHVGQVMKEEKISEYLYLQLTLKHCIRSCMVIYISIIVIQIPRNFLTYKKHQILITIMEWLNQLKSDIERFMFKTTKILIILCM